MQGFGIGTATRIVATGVAALLLGGPAFAQQSGSPPPDQDVVPPVSFHAALGFTLDPGTFLLAFGGEYHFNENFSSGPLLQLGFSDNNKIVAPTLNTRYSFDLSEVIDDEYLKNLRPFVQGGLGFAYIDKDRKGKDDDDTGFLMNLGFGVEYPLNETFSVGNNLMFNILPKSVVSENFFFSWQFATIRFRF